MGGNESAWSQLADALAGHYGLPDREGLPFANKPDPLDELIFITLAQRTHGAGTARAFNALKRRFPSWDDAAAADPAEIERLIEPSGLAFFKAPRISRMLRVLKEEHGTCNLGFLRDCPDDKAFAYLTKTLKAGYKTAWCVLLYSLGRDVFPADAHALRVLRRLGLLPQAHRHETLNRRIHDFVPPGRRYELHVNLILHGRAFCRVRPICGSCPLSSGCGFATFEGQVSDAGE